MIIREQDGTLLLQSDYDCTDLYADFDKKEIGTDLLDYYYNFTIPMDEFLEFADRIREELKEQEGKKCAEKE